MTMLNKRIYDCSLQHMRIFHMPICFFAALLARVLMHDIRYIEHACATVHTEFVALGILFRPTIPTMLVTLVVDYHVNMLLRTLAKYLCYFVAIEHLLTYRQDRETVCFSCFSCFMLIRWFLHRFTLFHFRGNFRSFSLICFFYLVCFFNFS